MTSRTGWDKNNPVVPFSEDGSRMQTKSQWKTEWRKVSVFRSQMKIVGYGNTQSSAYVELMDNQGITYPMYIGDLQIVLMTRNIIKGFIEESLWDFRKIGNSYGIVLKV